MEPQVYKHIKNLGLQFFVWGSIVCLLAIQFQDLTVQITFKLQQSTLEARFCQNRFTPELECFASCQLNQKLAKIHNSEENGDYSSVPEIQKSNFFLVPVIPAIPADMEDRRKAVFRESTAPLRLFAFALFHPPRQVAV